MLRRSFTSLVYLNVRRLLTRSKGPVAFLPFVICVASCTTVAERPLSTQAPQSMVKGESYQEYKACPAAREFIATQKFLTAKSEFKLDAKEIESIAQRVSSGCKGAAQRFASTVTLLSASGLGLHNALESGIELSAKNDNLARGFRQVFGHCYLKEHLDLDLLNCLKVANWLSLDEESAFQPDNFVKAVKTCTKDTGIQLSHSRCAKLAIRLAKVPFNSNTYSAADTFKSMFGFLTGDSGPKVGTIQAVKLAEFLASHSPSSADNYQVAFAFAKRNRDIRRAHRFALALAKKLPKSAQTQQTAE